jgi:hypothetical protein
MSSMVDVASYTYEIEAESVAIALAAHGIEYSIVNAGLVNSDSFLSNAVGGVKISVREEGAQRAYEIIEENRKMSAESSRYCYNCEATDIEKLRHDWKDVIICIITLGFGIPWVYKDFRCMKCGHKW